MKAALLNGGPQNQKFIEFEDELPEIHVEKEGHPDGFSYRNTGENLGSTYVNGKQVEVIKFDFIPKNKQNACVKTQL